MFPDTALKQAEEDISNADKGRSGSLYKKGRYHPYERQDSKSDNRRQDRPVWKNIARGHNKRNKGKHLYSSRPAKGQQPYKRQSMYNFVTGKAVDQEHINTKDNKHFKCKLSCCQSCSYCPRALTKERVKSRVSRLLCNSREIKICQRCFLCHSVVFCKTCNKCPNYCHKFTCRGQTSTLLGNLAKSGFRSESSSNTEGGLHPPLSDPTQTHKISDSHKPLCQSPQEQLPDGGITSAYRQKCSGVSKKQHLSRFFQPAIFSSQAKQKMEPYTRPEQSEFFPQGGEIQDGDTGNHQDIPPTRGVGHLDRLQGRLLPYTNTRTIQEISEISPPGSDIPIQGTSFQSVHSTLGVHCGTKRGKTDGYTQGYKDPPVPRRLVGESQIPPGLSPAYSGTGEVMPRTRLASKLGKIRTGIQADFRFCRLPVRPQSWSGPTHTGSLAEPSGQSIRNIVTTGLSGPPIHLPYRPTDSNRKASSPRPVTHETHTVASQKQLEGTRVTRKGDSNSQITEPSSTVVAAGGKHPHRPTITPNKTCSANLYRRIKRRVGRSLKRTHCKRVLVTTRKQTAYKLSGVKSSLLSSKRVSRPLWPQDGTCSNRQHYSSVIHKQGGRHEVGPTVCPSMENLDLVYQSSSNSQSPTHPRPAERSGRQAITARPDHSNRMVPPSRDFPSYMQQVAPTSDRSICHKVQQQVASVRVTSTGLLGSSSGCTQCSMGGSGRIRLPTSGHLGQSGGEVTGLPLQENYSDCSGVAKHALVLGSSDHVQSDPTEPAQPVDTTFQSDPSQKSDESKSPCMAPRATAIKEQGFSEAVATRIEAPQRGSTRSVYEAKWAIFTKWCITNQVDFMAPPVKSVADFLMYLFEDRKLQPSTIDGYRSAIADKLGNSTHC